MNWHLTRNTFNSNGIFGSICSDDGINKMLTLEHAYNAGAFIPKLAVGTYQVVRHPPNRLPYETFMVQGVPDFQGCAVSGILIHKGNYNADSEGCILLGWTLGAGCILDSKFAFDKFMLLMAGINEFTLVVS